MAKFIKVVKINFSPDKMKLIKDNSMFSEFLGNLGLNCDDIPEKEEITLNVDNIVGISKPMPYGDGDMMCQKVYFNKDDFWAIEPICQDEMPIEEIEHSEKVELANKFLDESNIKLSPALSLEEKMFVSFLAGIDAREKYKNDIKK